MFCPKCHAESCKVIDSRPSNDRRDIKRRRECESCGFRFTTYERIEFPPILVVKKNGNREEFNREKILRGIIRSAEKRPVSMETMNNIINIVETKIRDLGSNEVRSDLIGEYVMEELKDVDEISYIRFASVYRQFRDMSVFFNELKEVLDKDKKGE